MITPRDRPHRVLDSLIKIARKNKPRPISNVAMMASKEQKWVLLNLLNEHKEVIFAKLSASCTKDTKQTVWMHIYEECMKVGYPLPADANWRYFRDITWPNLRKQAYKKLEERNQAEAMGKVEVYVNDINQMVLDIMGLGGGGPPAAYDSNSSNPEQMADSSGYTGDIPGGDGGLLLDDSSMVEEGGSYATPSESDGNPVDFLGFSNQNPKSEPLSPGFSRFHPNQNSGGGGNHANEFNSVDSNDHITYHATLTGEVFDNPPNGTPKSQIVYQYQDSGASPPQQGHSPDSPQPNIRCHSVGGSNGAAAAIAEYQLAPSPHKMDTCQSSGGTQNATNVKYNNTHLYSHTSNLYPSNHRATQMGGRPAGSSSPRLPVNASGATISARQKTKPVAMAAAMTSSCAVGDSHASSGSHGVPTVRYHPYRQSQTAASHAPSGSGSNLSPPGSGIHNQQQSQFEIMNSLKIDREQAELELTRLKSYRLKLEIFQMEQSMGMPHAFDLKY